MNNLMTKSFMSYVDLKKEAMKDLEAGGGGVELPEMGVTDERLKGFFQETEAVEEEMAAIRDALARLNAANEEGKSVHQPDALRALRGRVNADIIAVLRRARDIRARLEAMDRANAAQRRLSAGCREGTPLDRTRTALTAALRKRLKDLMLDFQALRQRIMSEYKDTVERRYYTLTGEVPDEEVIERIISEGRSEELLCAAVAEHGKGAVLATVNEIQDRHDAAREVERSLLELHQVFLDMALLVESQGEQLDDIELHVNSATTYIKGANKELNKAREYQRGSRKCLCIGIVILLLIVLLIIVPIATSLKRSEMNILNQPINPGGHPSLPAARESGQLTPPPASVRFDGVVSTPLTTARAHAGQSPRWQAQTLRRPSSYVGVDHDDAVLAQPPFQPLTLDFLRSLLDKNDDDQVNAGAGVAPPATPLHALRVVVSSAVELDARQTELIARKMRRITGFVNLTIENVVDPSLIAGFVVCYGPGESHVIDLSVKGKLAALKSRVDSFDQSVGAHPHH
uniref:t-SNARE coiled-coil homology domain-containing protein n=1 Tax=Leersia perrieri TaxID=77586 RepID=A0A0D9VYQ2_9ORYZ